MSRLYRNVNVIEKRELPSELISLYTCIKREGILVTNSNGEVIPYEKQYWLSLWYLLSEKTIVVFSQDNNENILHPLGYHQGTDIGNTGYIVRKDVVLDKMDNVSYDLFLIIPEYIEAV